jgi:hypothetical protein
LPEVGCRSAAFEEILHGRVGILLRGGRCGGAGRGSWCGCGRLGE